MNAFAVFVRGALIENAVQLAAEVVASSCWAEAVSATWPVNGAGIRFQLPSLIVQSASALRAGCLAATAARTGERGVEGRASRAHARASAGTRTRSPGRARPR